MKTINVALDERTYPIHIGEGALDLLSTILSDLGAKGTVAIVTDSNVGPLYADRIKTIAERSGVNAVTCVLPAGEENKRLSFIEELCGSFLDANMDRTSIVIALGGGVVGDMAGFAAASFMRGIRFIQIPTTIVSQVDSSVGGKTGVNHPSGKNIIGSFHQPEAVLIEMSLLDTLPERELPAGLAEALKHGIIADSDLFEYMETNVDAILSRDYDVMERCIVRSCEIKSAVVSQDELEHGLRATLNYGHTFGHGIEAVTHYGIFLHGEAIGLGMHAAAVLAQDLGLVDEEFVTRQRNCIESYRLPVMWKEIPIDDTLEAMKHDKKVRAGTMKFIVPDRMGHVIQRTDVTMNQVRNALEALCG